MGEVIRIKRCEYQAVADDGTVASECDRMGAPVRVHDYTAYLCAPHRNWVTAMVFA
jgi:hypothetical protein